MPSEKIYRTTSIGREEIAVVWMPERDVQVGVALDADVEGSSLWLSLDRAEINRLIKALRRARDSAYGRDE